MTVRAIVLLLLLVPAFSRGGPADSVGSELRPMIERFTADMQLLERSFPWEWSNLRKQNLLAFYDEWRERLAAVPFEPLGREGQIDYLLFQNYLQHASRELRSESRADMAPVIGFAEQLTVLEDRRRLMQPVHPESTAALLTRVGDALDSTRRALEAASAKAPVRKTTADRAASLLAELRKTLKHWFEYYAGYDPGFTWWVEAPYKALDTKLGGYADFIKEKLVGIKPEDKTTIIGQPIGREALLRELAFEMIPYTPEELVEIANREFAWCEAEMKKASGEMGCGDDWKKALEAVKRQHVVPGEQPALVKELADEAIKFVDDRDLVTVPELARATWRMEMLTPRQQLISPFFLGGEVIQVAFPTNTMEHEQKQMSLRGNNRHFARATVFHELIPGHHLQGFMTDRYKPYRSLFGTPFWVEGNALYWEMVFWDLGFPKSPENRVGMLFWRMHRCARIIFSLSFHLGTMTPQQCVDFLVDRVGHERDNASAEVRRSFGGVGYGPLYQCAYMLGALQQRALRRELVETGKMTNRQFNDALLREGAIPVEMIRAALTDEPLSKAYTTRWKFYGPIGGR